MNYIVPNMKLVTQDKDNSCWYASADMLIQWRRRMQKMSEAVHPDPSQVSRWQKMYASTPEGELIFNPQIPALAKDLGLRMVPPMSPTPQGLLKLLVAHGPLWVNGKSHITVISGIRDTGSEIEVLVFDPSPDFASKTSGEWRSLRDWYAWGPVSGRDTSNDVQATFLYVP